MFLERVNFTLMGMVIDWVILMILLDQVVVKGRSLLNRWSLIIRELLLRLPWLLNLQLCPLLRALGFQLKWDPYMERLQRLEGMPCAMEQDPRLSRSRSKITYRGPIPAC
jgi:hypothetical protein